MHKHLKMRQVTHPSERYPYVFIFEAIPVALVCPSQYLAGNLIPKSPKAKRDS